MDELNQINGDTGYTVRQELVRSLLDIALGRLPPGLSAESSVRIKDRVEACKVVLAYECGAPARTVMVGKVEEANRWDDVDIDSLDESKLAQLETFLEDLAGTR